MSDLRPLVLPDATGDPLPSGLRFLFYCHDTFGLGHLRRTLTLAGTFTATFPDSEALIVTGSPMAHEYPMPARVDYVKIPSVTKSSDGAYRARDLTMPFSRVRDLRAAILREVADGYQPDVFLVDHAPLGLEGEALPALVSLQTTRPRCLRVLGLRDIVDDRLRVRRMWTEQGIYQVLRNGYDRILVYGSQAMFDVATEYALPHGVAQRLRYCGYLDRVHGAVTGSAPADGRVAALQQHADRAGARLVVLTVGGGGDGFPLLRAYLTGLRRPTGPALISVLLTGPLMDARERQELRSLAAALPHGTVHLETFVPDPLPLLNAADLVVSMAGYNSVCELLALRQRTLLCPRTEPRLEQWVRASRLAERGLVEVLHPSQWTPDGVMSSVLRSLERPRPRERQLADAGITFTGQRLAARAIADALADPRDQPMTFERDRHVAAQRSFA